MFDVRQNGQDGAEVFALFDFDRENPRNGYRRAGGKIVYPVTVKVEDQGRPKLSATCFFLVEVLDENDETPIFDDGPYHFYIMNNLPRGERVVGFVITHNGDILMLN